MSVLLQAMKPFKQQQNIIIVGGIENLLEEGIGLNGRTDVSQHKWFRRMRIWLVTSDGNDDDDTDYEFISLWESALLA